MEWYCEVSNKALSLPITLLLVAQEPTLSKESIICFQKHVVGPKPKDSSNTQLKKRQADFEQSNMLRPPQISSILSSNLVFVDRSYNF